MFVKYSLTFIEPLATFGRFSVVVGGFSHVQDNFKKLLESLVQL